MKLIKDAAHIAKKDLIEFSRDKLRLVTFFIMPFFMMILTGFIFPSQNSLKNIPIGIANTDQGIDGAQSANGAQLVEIIQNTEMGKGKKSFITSNYSDINSIKAGIKKQDISGGIFIPANFSEKISGNEQVNVIIIDDQSNPQVSAMVNQVLTQIVNEYSKKIGEAKVGNLLLEQVNPDVKSVQAIDGTAPSNLITPVTAQSVGIISGNPSYFEFVAPGVMAMVVMTSVLTGLAFSIAREKEQGTLDGILISPINRLAIILGKATSQATRGLIQGTIVLLLAIILFGVSVHGNILLVALLLLLGIFSFVGLGILVSAIATEQETASQLLAMFQFPMLFLSGTFFPIIMMPKAMQAISRLIPLTYAIDALRKVVVLGAGVSSITTELIVLFVFGLITLSISVPVFKRVITK